MNKNHENKFKTPEGYFDTFNERLLARMKAEEGDPNMNFLPKSDGFKVSEDYFDTLSDKIQSKTLIREPKVVQFKSWKKYYYAAASIAAIFVLSLLVFQKSEPELGFEDLANNEIEAYFENNDLGLSTYELVEAVNLEDISIVVIDGKALEEETILDYLDENVEDLEELELNYEELQY